VPGNLTIGMTNVPMTIRGAYTVYVAGDIIINSSILKNDNVSWAAFIAEGDIRLAVDAEKPTNILTLTGTFMANGNFRTENPGDERTGSQLLVTGGMVCLAEFKGFVGIWGTRTFNYDSFNDPNILLPNFSVMRHYEMLTGHY
jgi:hypothetical protein